jgi:Tfp pilus assembly protein PilN
MRHQLSLDYVANHQSLRSRLTGLGVMVFLIGVALTLYLFQQYQMKLAEYTQENTALQQVQLSKRADVKSAPAVSDADLKQVQAIIKDLNIPWDDLLSGLEQLEPQDIALLNLEPSVKEQRLILEGQAKNMQAVLNYIKALESLTMLSHVYLQNHSLDDVAPSSPVNFTIVAHW